MSTPIPSYDRYAAIDQNFRLPPEVRQAIADSDEVQQAVGTGNGGTTASPIDVVEDPRFPGMALFVASGVVPDTPDIAPVIITTELGGLTVGVAANIKIAATGEPDNFLVTSGSLPDGLVLSSTGVISGTPKTAGVYSFVITAQNRTDADTQSFNGSVAAAGSPPVITGPVKLSLTKGLPTSAQVTATGATPITYSITAGALPDGLTLSSSGLLSGTPTTAGAFSVTVKAQNANGSNSVDFQGTVADSTGTTPTNPGGGTNPGTNTGRIASYGPNGSHWPSRTPRPADTSGWDSNVTVACSWTAINQAIVAAQSKFPNGKCVIFVEGGTLSGNGSGSTSTPVLQNIGGSGRATRILVIPKDGPFSIKHSASARIHNVQGVSFVGFSPWAEGVPESQAYGVVFTNCKDVAWAWSKGRHFNVTSSAGTTDGVEFVECVAPEQGVRDDDRSAIRNGDGGNTYNVLFSGCYLAGTYKANGSSAHCDTLQLSGPGVFDGIDFLDTALFGSTNAVYITTEATSGQIRHSLFLGGMRTALRYPVGSDRSQFISGPVTFNGAPTEYSAIDGSILVGKIVPVFSLVTDSKASQTPPAPKSGSWIMDTTLLDTKEKIDALSPLPTDALMRQWWSWK